MSSLYEKATIRGVIRPAERIMHVMNSCGSRLPFLTRRSPIGSTPKNVAGVKHIVPDCHQMHFLIHLIKQSAPSLAASTNFSYELPVLPNALITSIPFMYSTAVSFKYFVF